MEHFASGPKSHYYGKGDVIVYRLLRDHAPSNDSHPVFGARVLLLVYGAAFWPTYESGDNTGLIATDSMKNFVQRETMDFEGRSFDAYCRFLADRFLSRYPQVEGLQVTAEEIPYVPVPGGRAFTTGGPERAFARLEQSRTGMVEAASGLRGFRLLRMGGSSFRGFVRDEYTTLPDVENRPLHMWLDLEWDYLAADATSTDGRITAAVRRLVTDTFQSFDSGSIQQLIHRIGNLVLAAVPEMREIRLEANNRTWDTIAERGASLGVYTDARPPYGCLGLRLTR